MTLTNTKSQEIPKVGAEHEHHLKASEHLEIAAKSHKDAAKHLVAGDHKSAAQHASIAQEHTLQAGQHVTAMANKDKASTAQHK